MKKLIITCLVMISVLSPVNARFTKTGGGITGSTGIAWHNKNTFKSFRTNNPAITLKGIYEINAAFHIEPSFTFFMPRVRNHSFDIYSSKHIVSAMMFDVNGQYIFNSQDKFQFYGLAGLNITLIGSKWKLLKEGTEPSHSKESDNAFGLNIGSGTQVKITEQFNIYGEARYITGRYDQFVFNAGVLINIKRLIKHKNRDKRFNDPGQ